MREFNLKRLLLLGGLVAVFALMFGCKTTQIIVPTDIPPGTSANLETIQKVVLWGEAGTINLQDIINSKRCAMSPKDVIGTDAKIDLVATKEVQQNGGKVAIAIHPFYSPWNKGADASLSLLQKNAKHYDYIAIDYEARWIDFEFVNKCKQFGKPVVIAPLARADSMLRDYDSFSQMENVTFLWWNYSYQLDDWQNFFRDYEFKDSCKHLVLLSVGDKYDQYVSDKEIKNIILNLKDVRCGVFSPKNDYETFRTMRNDLIKSK